jgi:hypothetical protein
MKSSVAETALFAALTVDPASAQTADSIGHPKPKGRAPFAFADFTWLNGNSRQRFSVLDTKAFTGEFRADIAYIGSFNHPKDHTLVGTSASGRTNEIQVQQLGVGGDFHYGHARGRLKTQFGCYDDQRAELPGDR